LAIGFGPKVLAALLILIVGLFVGPWIGRLLERVLKKLHLEAPMRQLLVRIVRVLVLGVVLDHGPAEPGSGIAASHRRGRYCWR